MCATTPHAQHQLLQELADEIEKLDLKMNTSKTKMMMENDTPIYVNNTQIENIESYAYLRQSNKTREKHQGKEIQIRITVDGQQDSQSTATSSRVALKHA